MANIAARTALAEFMKDLDRVDRLMILMHRFRDFAGDESELTGHAQELWKAAGEARTDLPLLSGSLLLYLCGRFEFFVRELLGTIIDDMVDKAARYQDLPSGLRRFYVSRTMSINESPEKYNHSTETAGLLIAELAQNLSGMNDNSPNLRVSASVVTMTDNNMRPDILADLFGRVGISKVWETLGKQLQLKRYLDEVSDGDCTVAAKARLEGIMSERNKIAHPVGDMEFPDANSVQNVAAFFRILAQVLEELALAPR